MVEKDNAIPVIDIKATGENIKRLREAAGISVRELQEVFGFATPQSIYKWQYGISIPSIDNFAILAKQLGVTIDEILVTVDSTDSTSESKK